MHSGAQTLSLSGDVAFPGHGTLDKTSQNKGGISYHIIGGSSKVLSRQTHLLPRQKYTCRDKIMFVVKNVVLFFKNIFYLSLQTRVCRDKSQLLATKDVFCPDKHVFVETKLLWLQK